MTVGERMKKLRKENGLTLEDLAQMLGKNRSTIHRYEKGEIENLPLASLEPIATALKTTPAYLMGWEEDENCITVEIESNQTSDSSGRIAEYIKRISILASGMKEKDLEMVIGFMERLKGE